MGLTDHRIVTRMVSRVHLDISDRACPRQLGNDPFAPLLAFQRTARPIFASVQLTPARLPAVRHVVPTSRKEQVARRGEVGIGTRNDAGAEQGVEQVDRSGGRVGKGGIWCG